MSCSQTCTQGQKTFIFSTNQANFEDARRQCRNRGATLATNLNRNDYSKFLSCCSANEQNRFWIGLENVGRDTCRSRLQWINSGRCVNEDPLNVQTQPLNNVCRAVLIFPGQRADNGNVPRSNTDQCTIDHFYICQRIRSTPTTTRRTTTSTLRSITTSTTTTTTTKSLTTTQGGRISSKSLATTQTSLINDQPTSMTSDTFSNVGAIVGGVVSCLVLMLIFMLFLYLWKRKKNSLGKRFFQSKPNPKIFVSNSVNGRMSVDQTYYIVERSSEKHHNGVLNSFVDDSDVHVESTSYNDAQEIFSGSNDYQEINNQANDMNVYDQVAKPEVECESSKYDQLHVKREQKDHPHSEYSEITSVQIEVEDTANKSPVVVYATVDRKKKPSMDVLYAVVDKSKQSN